MNLNEDGEGVEVAGALQLYRVNSNNETQHTVLETLVDKQFSDCWCEPRHVYIKNPQLSDKQLDGVYYVVMHDGPWVRPQYPNRNRENRIMDSIKEPPAQGWQAHMDTEDVDDLINDVLKNGWKNTKLLIQQKGESTEQFYKRLKAIIEDEDTTELEYEAEDPESLLSLFERDDDFDIETDEEE